jgi:hypothetical protein
VRRRPVAVATRTEWRAAPRGVPKVLVAQARSDDLQHDQVQLCGSQDGDRAAGPHCTSPGRSNPNITAGGRCVELGMNSRYRGVNTRRPGMNS